MIVSEMNNGLLSSSKGGTREILLDSLGEITKVANVIMTYVMERTGWRLDPFEQGDDTSDSKDT